MALTYADTQAIAAAQASHPNLPPGLLSAIAMQESSGDAGIVNTTSGAAGLFQVLKSTAAQPGYGVAPLDPARRTDPAAEANFAADYLTAQQGRTGSWAGAVAAYSGGGYSLGTLQAGYPAYFDGSPGVAAGAGGADLSTDASTGISQGAASAGAAGSALGSAASSLLNPVWEYVSRALLIFMGLCFCLLAAAAMLWQSKTVQTTAGRLQGTLA